MECKNCGLPLRSDYSFCSNCGAKVIRNRLTLKNLWYDFTERYFNIDNTFFKTFGHLFTKPELVIGSYIDGIRKKYVNPISYYAIAITLTGLLFFLLKEFFVNQMSMDWMTPKGTENLNENTFDNTAKYQSIISVISIPLYGLLSKLMFLRNKNFNYTEHIIINLYAFAQYSIASFPIMIIALILGGNYLAMTYIAIFFQIIYVSYVLKRIFKLTLGKIVLKTFLFIMFLLLFFIIIGIGVAIVGILIGYLSGNHS